MNVPLVESLVQVIFSLSPEERALLEERLHRKTDWRETLQNMQELGDKITARRGGQPLEPPPEEIIRQMREERAEQLMNNCFPECELK